MDTLTVLSQVRQSGLQLGLRNGQLAVKPPARLNEELRRQLRANRDNLTLAVKNAPGRLVQLAIQAGIHEQGIRFSPSDIRRLAGNDELQDAINCTREELQGWASSLAIRAMQRRGLVPRGWDKTAICACCGPVYSFHELNTLSCGWCWMRHAEFSLPRPADQ